MENERLAGHAENPRLKVLATLEPPSENKDINIVLLRIFCRLVGPRPALYVPRQRVQRAELTIRISDLDNGPEPHVLPTEPENVFPQLLGQNIEETQRALDGTHTRTTARWLFNKDIRSGTKTPDIPTINLRIRCPSSRNNGLVNAGFRISVSLTMQIARQDFTTNPYTNGENLETVSSVQEMYRGSMKVRLMRRVDFVDMFRNLAPEALELLEKTQLALKEFETEAGFINDGAKLEMNMVRKSEQNRGLLKKIRRDSADLIAMENTEKESSFDNNEVGSWHDDIRTRHFESLEHC
jgi:hypothetical protein